MDRRLIGRAGIGVAVVLAVSTALAGCGGGRKASVSHAGQLTSGGRTMHFQLAAASVTAEVPGQSIATTPTTIPGVTLQLYLAKRVNPDAVLVVFALGVDSAAASGTVIVNLADGLSANGPGANITVSGVSLFDSSGLKRYETFMADPSRDATCLCSSLTSVGANNAGTYYLAALVAAPPASVSSVSFVTGLGTIPNVTLS